jgi:YD repeat-containing protein
MNSPHTLACLLLTALMLLFPAASGAQNFTVEDALASVVTFEPLSHNPGVLMGDDAQGRTVWINYGERTLGYRYDESGKRAEMVDQHGNRTLYSFEGNLHTSHHFRNHAGQWFERFLLGDGGGSFLEISSWTEDDLAPKLALLGLAAGERPAAPRHTWSKLA